MNKNSNKLVSQSNAINAWVNSVLIPFFLEYEKRMISNKTDELLIDIWLCFAKNSCAMFELLLMRNTSYQIAQTMRLLVELTADTDFILKHKENITHLKNEANAIIQKCEKEADKNKWRDYIAEAGDISLEIEGKPAYKNGFETTKRVETVFGKGFYDFYSGYSHMNIFVLRDDGKRLADDDFISAQRWELVKDFPLIIERFANIMGIAAKNTINCSQVVEGFSSLFSGDKMEEII